MASNASSASGSRPRRDEERPWYTILEPHASLRYVGKLFKALAIGLFLLLIAELGIGIAQDGVDALPLLLLEVAQLVLFTGLMWGAGDLAYIVIETNHDVRASRVLLWQLNMLQRMELGDRASSVDPIDPERPITSE
jgi:hypothetical protein